MAKISMFVVFHRILDELQIFGDFDESEIRKWFVEFGVNERYREKTIVRKNGDVEILTTGRDGVVLEYELGSYRAELQSRGFMETSCYVHVEANRLYGDADLIGVCQYDMRWTPEAAALLRKLSAKEDVRGVGYGISVGPIVDREGSIHPYAYADRRN